MAINWGRLFGSRSNISGLAEQLNNLENNVSELTNTNAYLQQLLNIQFRNQGGFTRFDTISQIDFIRNGYNISSAVYSLVSDIAQKSASIPLKASIVVDEAALKNYKLALRQPFTNDNIYLQKKLRQKALVQVDSQEPLQKLLDNPNLDDDPRDFYETVAGFRLLCGNSFLYCPVLDAGSDKGKVTEMRIMPSPFTGIIVVQGFPAQILGYELIIDGVRLMRSSEVIHLKYPNYDWSIDGQQLYGLAPLRAAFQTLRRSNSAEASSTAMFDNGGPAVIVANESISSDQLGLEQAGKIKKNWASEHSGNQNRGKIKLMAGKIGVHPLGISPVDMNIIESEKWSFDMICNVFKVHSVLYNIHVSSNFNNIEQLRKDNWASAYIPERQAQADAFNRKIVPGYNTATTKYFVELDLSGIADLQADRQVTATWLNTSWWIPPNKKLEIQGIEENPDPNMDKIWMPSGYTTMDDATINVDLLPNDNNANTGQDNAIQP